MEWIIDRYQVAPHKDSQVPNNSNYYASEIVEPRYIIDLIQRIVKVSLETNKIVELLPALDMSE